MWADSANLMPPNLRKGIPCLPKFYFQIERVRAGAKQHGDLAERHALLTQFFYALGDEPRLLIFVMRADDHRGFPSLDAREQSLLVAFFHVLNNRVGHVEDGLSAAKVLFQFDDLRGGKEFGKLQHVSVSSRREMNRLTGTHRPRRPRYRAWPSSAARSAPEVCLCPDTRPP